MVMPFPQRVAFFQRRILVQLARRRLLSRGAGVQAFYTAACWLDR
jgi:hypothetical protein